MTTAQKIAEIEQEMARTQKNKATETHLGLLKAKLAKLKRELLEPSKGAGGGGMDGFDVKSTGDARVGLIDRLPFRRQVDSPDSADRTVLGGCRL